MQPRPRTRFLPSGLRGGRFCRWTRFAKRLDVSHQLPALRLRQFRPNRHSLSDDAVRQHPENRAGRGALNLRNAEAWGLLAAMRSIAMTFHAVLFEENSACGNG